MGKENNNRFIRIETTTTKEEVGRYLNLTLTTYESLHKCDYKVLYYDEQTAHKNNLLRITIVLEKIKTDGKTKLFG